MLGCNNMMCNRLSGENSRSAYIFVVAIAPTGSTLIISFRWDCERIGLFERFYSLFSHTVLLNRYIYIYPSSYMKESINNHKYATVPSQEFKIRLILYC